METTIMCYSRSSNIVIENCALYNVEEKHFVEPIRIGNGKLYYDLKPFRNYLLLHYTKLKNSVYYFGMTRLYNFDNTNVIEQHLFEVMIPPSQVKEIIDDPYAPGILKDFLKLKPEGNNPALPNFLKKYTYFSRDWKIVVDKIEEYLDEVT